MAEEQPHYQDRIDTDPERRVGTPTIKGTRISVEQVLAQLETNPDPGALLAAYPELALADVQAALAYARAVLRDARTQDQDAARDRRFRRVLAIAQRNPHGDGD